MGDLQNTWVEAGYQLLSTKLAPPRLNPHLVPREALLARLDAGLEQKLTLISAPAGFGKTTLVRSWLDQVDLPAAWLSLDEDDNDFARFWTYVITALQGIRPEVGTEMLALLQASPLPPSHMLLTLLINELAANSEPCILVLDDYHLIETESIDQSIDYFIDHLPLRMHLVLAGRADPSLSLPQLRASGQLNELRSIDLRFTEAETAQFLEQMTSLSLAPAEVAALDRRTEGWIAGLQMAALAVQALLASQARLASQSHLSLRQREAADIAQFIEDFGGSHRYIMDYLMDEVLQRQPAEVQTFLLYTSILDRLCAPLCEALLGDLEATDGDRDATPPLIAPGSSTAQELLAYLEHTNLFITPLDDQRQWYRYHQLFAELLRSRLRLAYPDQIAKLHLIASQWHEQAGFANRAVQHTLAARAFGRAALLVEQVAPALIERGEFAMLLTWLDTLPAEEVQARPLLGLYYCRVLYIIRQIKRAAAQLEAIEARLEGNEAKHTPEIQSHTALMRAHLAWESGDLAAAIALFRQALALLPAQDSLLRPTVTLHLAMAHYLQGEFEPASHLFTEIIATGQTAPLIGSALLAIYIKVQILRAQGALQEALQLCQDELDLVTRHRWQNFPAAGSLYVTFGELSHERNELNRAAEYLEKGVKLGQAEGYPFISIAGHVWLAWLRQTQGDMTSSQEAIRTALQLVQHYQVNRFLPVPPAACYQARLWITQGNLAAASRWAQAGGVNQTDTPATYFDEVEYLTLARVRIAQGNLEAAETLLLWLQQAAASAGRGGSLIEILILQAITLAAQDRGEEALAALEQALGLAEPEGFVRIFLDEGAPIARLLRRAVAQDRHASYALHLLNALGETTAAPQPLINPLSERELEILRRVAAGYSNKEIAQDLVLAANTVKKHISNIYGKLEVGSRTQAVARARELGLL